VVRSGTYQLDVPSRRGESLEVAVHCDESSPSVASSTTAASITSDELVLASSSPAARPSARSSGRTSTSYSARASRAWCRPPHHTWPTTAPWVRGSSRVPSAALRRAHIDRSLRSRATNALSSTSVTLTVPCGSVSRQRSDGHVSRSGYSRSARRFGHPSARLASHRAVDAESRLGAYGKRARSRPASPRMPGTPRPERCRPGRCSSCSPCPPSGQRPAHRRSPDHRCTGWSPPRSAGAWRWYPGCRTNAR
jgi:hypothetical protein